MIAILKLPNIVEVKTVIKDVIMIIIITKNMIINHFAMCATIILLKSVIIANKILFIKICVIKINVKYAIFVIVKIAD